MLDCFNGATTLQSWKLVKPSDEYITGSKVSMGPRHYSRGNLYFLCPQLFRQFRFNGATTLQSWKPFRENFGKKKENWFQWGHDITVVETNCGESECL